MQIWAETGKPALPIRNYSQILYQFLTFTQNLKQSPTFSKKCLQKTSPFEWCAATSSTRDMQTMPFLFLRILLYLVPSISRRSTFCVVSFSCHKISLQTGKFILHQFEGLHKLWDTPF